MKQPPLSHKICKEKIMSILPVRTYPSLVFLISPPPLSPLQASPVLDTAHRLISLISIFRELKISLHLCWLYKLEQLLNNFLGIFYLDFSPEIYFLQRIGLEKAASSFQISNEDMVHPCVPPAHHSDLVPLCLIQPTGRQTHGPDVGEQAEVHSLREFQQCEVIVKISMIFTVF